MKKRLFVLIIAMMLFSACGEASVEPAVEETPAVETPAEEEVIVEEPVVEEAVEEEIVSNSHIVAIDPGHQLHQNSEQEASAPGSSKTKMKVTSGTRGKTTGKKEYELTLEVSLLLRDELEARGYTVVLTRDTHDINISNQERAAVATENNADIFIRIHADGNDNSSVNGATALVPGSNNAYVGQFADDSSRLGKAILSHYCDTTGIHNRGLQNGDTMTGINFATMPVVIIEMGFMSNSSDDSYMANADNQGLMAKGIADGVDEYFGE